MAAVLAAFQNGVALAVGKFMNIDPLISMMTGSIPMTGGHGNAASFAPIAVDAGAPAAMEVASSSSYIRINFRLYAWRAFWKLLSKKI